MIASDLASLGDSKPDWYAINASILATQVIKQYKINGIKRKAHSCSSLCARHLGVSAKTTRFSRIPLDWLMRINLKPDFLPSFGIEK